MYRAQEGRGKKEWRRLHNKELHELPSSTNIIYVIKLRRMRCAGNVV
jgi:hypothetical protein